MTHGRGTFSVDPLALRPGARAPHGEDRGRADRGGLGRAATASGPGAASSVGRAIRRAAAASRVEAQQHRREDQRHDLDRREVAAVRSAGTRTGRPTRRAARGRAGSTGPARRGGSAGRAASRSRRVRAGRARSGSTRGRAPAASRTRRGSGSRAGRPRTRTGAPAIARIARRRYSSSRVPTLPRVRARLGPLVPRDRAHVSRVHLARGVRPPDEQPPLPPGSELPIGHPRLVPVPVGRGGPAVVAGSEPLGRVHPPRDRHDLERDGADEERDEVPVPGRRAAPRLDRPRCPTTVASRRAPGAPRAGARGRSRPRRRAATSISQPSGSATVRTYALTPSSAPTVGRPAEPGRVGTRGRRRGPRRRSRRGRAR